jgi:hypothetical protein
MAEELAFEDRLRQRAAVDRHERTFRTVATLVDRRGDELLPSPSMSRCHSVFDEQNNLYSRDASASSAGDRPDGTGSARVRSRVASRDEEGPATRESIGDVWYTYGMEKTTVYLPADLKRALARLARQRRTSEASLLRQAVARLTDEHAGEAPRLPLFRTEGPSIAEDVDRALEGFGRR